MHEAYALTRQWSDAEMIPVIELVSRQMGLSFPPGRMASVEQTLRRARLDAGSSDWESFRQRVITNRKTFDALAAALTVNESYFFRDPAQFDFLRTAVLPALAAEAEPIRFWSAGCAVGQEPYTLAILCDQLGIAHQSRIVGTDIAARRLAAAARGRFARWSLRGVSPEIVEQYFTRVDVRYEIREAIRSLVEFRSMNLVDPVAWSTAPTPVDILLCRNVLIYLSPDAIQSVAQRLIASLTERGCLLLGASDPPISDYVECRVEITPAGLVYRRPGARQVKPAPRPIAVPSAPVTRPTPREVKAPPPPVRRAAEPIAKPPTVTAVRELADSGKIQAAIDACSEALRAQPTSIELCYLQTMLLLRAGRHAESAAAARRALYLDRSLILGHTALGIALAQLGDRAGSVRSLTTARELLAPLSDDEVLPAGGGEIVSRVRASVIAHLGLFDRQ